MHRVAFVYLILMAFEPVDELPQVLGAQFAVRVNVVVGELLRLFARAQRLMSEQVRSMAMKPQLFFHLCVGDTVFLIQQACKESITLLA